MLLFTQLPERNGAGGGNVEGIDPVGHGDAHRVIAGGKLFEEILDPASGILEKKKYERE